MRPQAGAFEGSNTESIGHEDFNGFAEERKSEGEEMMLHPDAQSMFNCIPFASHIPIFSTAAGAYGPRCVGALGLIYFLNKGLGNNFIGYSRTAMFIDHFKLNANRYQRLQSISKMGWSIKAFSAALSDSFACFHYTKRWYCAASCVLGGTFTLIYALLPGNPSAADLGAGFVFLASFCMANIDILSEGHYSRLMREKPAAGAALVSWIWWFILAASLVAAGIQGPLSDAKKPQIGLYISAATQAVAVFFFIFNWYGEKTNREERLADSRAQWLQLNAARAAAVSEALPYGSEEPNKTVNKADMHPESSGEQVSSNEYLGGELLSAEQQQIVMAGVVDDEDDFDSFAYREPVSFLFGAIEFNREMCLMNWRILVYSFVMVCSVISMTCVTILGGSYDLLYCSIAVAVVNCSMAFWACSMTIAKAIVFIYLNLLLYLQLPGALDNFYRASETCFPEGPHFSYTFYVTVSAIIGNVGGLVGVTAFTYIFSKQSYCCTFIVTTIVQVIASIFDIIIVKRWNLYIGIPDHAMYILGDAIVYEVCYYIAWMPMVVLLSRVCPRGSESMVYALVAGFGNMGSSMSSSIGSLLMELVWPVTSTGVCDFHNVPMLLLVGHILLPLLIIPLAFFMLPRARICDDIDVDGKLVKKMLKKEEEEMPKGSSDLNSEPICERK